MVRLARDDRNNPMSSNIFFSMSCMLALASMGVTGMWGLSLGCTDHHKEVIKHKGYGLVSTVSEVPIQCPLVGGQVPNWKNGI